MLIWWYFGNRQEIASSSRTWHSLHWNSFSGISLTASTYAWACLPILLLGESVSRDTWRYSCWIHINKLDKTNNKVAGAVSNRSQLGSEFSVRLRVPHTYSLPKPSVLFVKPSISVSYCGNTLTQGITISSSSRRPCHFTSNKADGLWLWGTFKLWWIMKPDCMFKLQHLQEVTFRAITADQGFTSGYYLWLLLCMCVIE